MYWEQVVQNILGGSSPKSATAKITVKKDETTKMSVIKNAAVKLNKRKDDAAKIHVKKDEAKHVAAVKITVKKNEVTTEMESVVMIKPNTVLKNDDDVKARKKRTKRKNLKVEEGLKNLSITTDEGIDTSYCAPISANITSIPNVIMKPQHQLSSSWTFWYSVGDKNLSWVQNQVKICTVTTIEQFWYVTSQLQPPSKIPSGHTYSVFKTGVMPDWEDVANVDGGRWMISCSKEEREEELDSMWLEILVTIVGEHMGETAGLAVNGAEACVRKKGDRLEVWMADVAMMMGVVEVGRNMKKKLGLDAKRKMKFSLHKEDREGLKGPRLAL